MTDSEYDGLTLLKKGAGSYEELEGPSGLETFPNKYPKRDYLVRFDCPEFTSVCPITGQPDFARITITYIPDAKCIESKSLKMYLFAFRNKGMFHEEITNKILEDVVVACEPRWARVLGKMNPRGGISIDVTADYTKPGFKAPGIVGLEEQATTP
ncbi:preQ(1) synthase [Thermodesulfobacteriota bacterium]